MTVSFHPTTKKAITKVFAVNQRQYYRFVNLADLPVLRYKRAMAELQELQYGMTNELLNEHLNAIAKAVQAGDSEKALYYVHSCRSIANECALLEIYYNLGACVLFTLQEDILHTDSDVNSRKIADFQSLDDAFFLQTLSENLGLALPVSCEHLTDYLKGSNKKIATLQRILRKSAS